jgi:hypothetical protein
MIVVFKTRRSPSGVGRSRPEKGRPAVVQQQLKSSANI